MSAFGLRSGNPLTRSERIALFAVAAAVVLAAVLGGLQVAGIVLFWGIIITGSVLFKRGAFYRPPSGESGDDVRNERNVRTAGQAEAVEAQDEVEVDISPIGLGVALVGSLAMIIAVFLPYADPKSFAQVAQNSLIQSGGGWWFVGLAVASAVAVFRAYQQRRPSPGPIIAGVIALGFAIYYGTSSSELTLCPTGPGSALLNLGCEKANPGIGIYLAGVAGVLMIVGGWQIQASKKQAHEMSPITPAAREEKTYPECAETVKAAARVCKHCGFRFAP